MCKKRGPKITNYSINILQKKKLNQKYETQRDKERKNKHNILLPSLIQITIRKLIFNLQIIINLTITMITKIMKKIS